jgi:hypothetical protein
MKQLINSGNKTKIAICTYHKPNDYKDITDYISGVGMTYSTSKNYMLFDDKKPFFRRGLIRAIR